MAEIKIGETFKELGRTFRVVKSRKADCDKCAFYRRRIRCSTTQNCTPDFREDGQYVIFKEVKDARN